MTENTTLELTPDEVAVIMAYRKDKPEPVAPNIPNDPRLSVYVDLITAYKEKKTGALQGMIDSLRINADEDIPAKDREDLTIPENLAVGIIGDLAARRWLKRYMIFDEEFLPMLITQIADSISRNLKHQDISQIRRDYFNDF